MNKEILFILLPDYAAHEAVYFSQAITADDFAMKKNPKYVNKVVAPTLEPISSIGGFRTLPDYSFDTMPDDYVALVLIGGFGWNTPVAEKVMPIIKSAIEQEKVIGAICNAASFMAKCGIDRETTSKTLQKSSVIQKISVTLSPAVSIKSEMVFVCGWNDASGWEVTGLDWKSGATRHRSILGKNNRANGAYAIIQYLANGDLLFNSVAGPIRVKY